MGKPAKLSKFVVDGNRSDNIIDGSTYSGDIQSRGMVINGNDGNDTLSGGSGQDFLNGGSGNDTLIADLNDLRGVGNDNIVYDGGTGSDTLDLSHIPYASGTGVWLQAAPASRTDYARISTDVHFHHGSLQNDTPSDPQTWGETFLGNFRNIENFILGDGNDLVQLLNPSGDNRVYGGGGDDYIMTTNGNDYLDGGSGNDLLNGQYGSDVLVGGAGNDMFVFSGAISGQYEVDTITDFETRTSTTDTSFDQLWIWNSYTIDWDESRPDNLHAFIVENGVTRGEVAFQGLTLADVPNIVWHFVDPSTGDPYGGTA